MKLNFTWIPGKLYNSSLGNEIAAGKGYSLLRNHYRVRNTLGIFQLKQSKLASIWGWGEKSLQNCLVALAVYSSTSIPRTFTDDCVFLQGPGRKK